MMMDSHAARYRRLSIVQSSARIVQKQLGGGGGAPYKRGRIEARVEYVVLGGTLLDPPWKEAANLLAKF